MKIDLTEEEKQRIEALCWQATDAQMRGTNKKDRPRVMLLRIVERGLGALESEADAIRAAESKAGGS